MANKIISINTNTDESKKKLDLYRDLSMVASRKNVRSLKLNKDG